MRAARLRVECFETALLLLRAGLTARLLPVFKSSLRALLLSILGPL